ncbi:MAG: GNAT family N-acetyltransferase [Hyphomicrobiales bacterium]|nr:GNAT family N-acetyltransferase [Hyphomicrobiales bacterium]
MSHVLDRPVWSALTSRHAALAEGGGFARRYPQSVHPFACCREDSAANLTALAELALPGEEQVFLQADKIVVPPGFDTVALADGVQMVADKSFHPVEDARIEMLGEPDARAMLDLATLTRPGPFTMRALSLGEFWGIKASGRLIAMAGERLKVEGMTEISGVCTHPEFRSQGLGRLLTVFVASRICARGEQPFLHTHAANETARALYGKLGFRLRTQMNIAVIKRLT